MAPPTRPRIVIGLDVGKSAHWACVVTREGELLASGPIPNREDAIDGLYARYPGALVVVDQVRDIGSLALSRAKLAGMPRAYLPGLATHGASKLFAGDAKTDERDAMYNVHLHGAAAQRGPARGMEGLRRLVHRCVRQPGRRRDPIGRPKTPASVVHVPVPEFAADFLEEWRAQQARIFDADGDTPICSWDGSFLKPSAMSVWWQRESVAWGVPYTMHELRHTFITLLARAGVHPRTMQ